MKYKGLTKKSLIKELEQVQGDPLIGINVLTDQGSEFWQIGKRHLKLMDRGQTLALFQCRLKKALPIRVQMNVTTPSVDSVQADIKDAVAQLTDRFDIDLQIDNIEDIDLQYTILSIIRKDIQELVRLSDDFVRLFKKKELANEFRYN